MRGALILTLWLVFLSHPSAACYDGSGSSGQKRFVLRGDEAFDSKTGLTWKRCSFGTKADDGHGCVGQKAFVNFDQALRSAKTESDGWHVPSGPELESLVDISCGNPVVDVSVFPDVHPDIEGAAEYWTTNEVGVANLIYYFDFMTGRADGHSRGFQLAVRLVKKSK